MPANEADGTSEKRQNLPQMSEITLGFIIGAFQKLTQGIGAVTKVENCTKLVAVAIYFKRSFLRQAKVLCLLGSKFGQFDT